jgi:hypothetical protein
MSTTEIVILICHRHKRERLIKFYVTALVIRLLFEKALLLTACNAIHLTGQAHPHVGVLLWEIKYSDLSHILVKKSVQCLLLIRGQYHKHRKVLF